VQGRAEASVGKRKKGGKGRVGVRGRKEKREGGERKREGREKARGRKGGGRGYSHASGVAEHTLLILVVQTPSSRFKLTFSALHAKHS